MLVTGIFLFTMLFIYSTSFKSSFTLSSIYMLVLTHRSKKLSGNTVEKDEIAQNKQFHLFAQCFLCKLYLKIL